MAIDAYRELHSRKLFWVTLALSGLVVVVFAALGIDDEGLRILWFGIKSPFINTQFIPEADFYRGLFMGLGMKFWLSWLAVILAIVSTAGIFPELITGGSIDLWLSRPISRWRLFVTKFLLGMVFVVLQVTIFVSASFLVLGLRGGIWEPALFIAIPLVTLFFSYLFAICVLLGVLTKSTVAAILITLVAWFGIFMVHSTESILFMGRVSSELELRSIGSEIDRYEEMNEPVPEPLAEELDKARRADRWWVGLHSGVFALKTALPKTEETIELLGRTLIDLAAMPEEEEAAPAIDAGPFGSKRVSGVAIVREVQQRIRVRPVWWVLGTSILFVFATSSLAGWLFCRRDY